MAANTQTFEGEDDNFFVSFSFFGEVCIFIDQLLIYI